jgi:hemerythrin-like metal-binding protein
LHEADRRKDEFLGMLSHELRNPLAPIRSSIYLLEHAAPGSEQALRAKEVIRRQTAHLTRLVDDLLDVRRLSTGKFRLHTVRLDLARHVRDAVEDMRAIFALRSLALELDVPAEPVWVSGDATRLAQVVTNLLHNASKFTNAGGHVQVSVESRGAEAAVRVRDDGVGVAPHLLPRLFEPFVQDESTLHRTRGGLGLGLSLVRGIAELHGGAVRVHSEGLGKGTEFVVTLPTSEPAVALAGAVAPTTGPSKRRVLVVEDSRDSAESLRDLLETIGGHEVHVASDGLAGVNAAREHPPEIVLCDLGLPGIDGFEVARRIRAATGDERDCRLVALSGYAAPDAVERSLRAGFDYHVAKPPDVEGLLKLVAEAPGRGPPSALRDQLATGHHEVDAQHAAILAEAERLRRGGPDVVWDSLQFLQHHATSHFAYEEALMDDVRYPRAALHQDEHLAFATELVRHRERLQREGATPENVAALADAVESWVTEHVLGEDRQLAAFIRERGTAAA